jgi:8-amino-7-oxononanoate synthase
MTDPLIWIAEELRDWTSQGLLRRRRTIRSLGDGWCEIDGRRILDCASNDYLNLTADPRVVAAARDALETSGVGARASALICGRTEWHVRLEQRLARFEGQPAAVLFPTGMAANVGTVTALCGSRDLVLCDRFNHASLVDGSRLSAARLRIYRHDDLHTLDRELAKGADARRRWIVTDGVFSMDGDLAPLPELCDIAERHSAAVIVDEAHGTGVFGSRGRGACELLGVENRVAVRVGTLSKAIGALGGFVTGSTELVDFLWNRARSQIYSTALPPAICAAAMAAVDIMESEPARRERLATASTRFRDHLRTAGVEPMSRSVGPIVPIVLNDPSAATSVAERLEKRGFLVGAIRPPTVPRGTSRLRIVVSTAHAADDLARLAFAIGEEIAGFHKSGT